jgi:hypothetical protein
MRFGVREVTDIVFRTKFQGQQVGSATYAQYTPVMIVDSAKMSTLENTVSTVYAQGGKGNPRLLAWDGDRTAVFKFEEAIITNDGLAILTGSDISSTTTQTVRQQHAFTTSGSGAATVTPTIPSGAAIAAPTGISFALLELDIKTGDIVGVTTNGFSSTSTQITTPSLKAGTPYIIDFYVTGAGKQLQVEPSKFAGYYYIEANTLFRDQAGTDHPAQISIPKGKLKSNFTITMSPTGDPTTFNFEIDALPDNTFNITDKKVLYSLDIADVSVVANELV